MIINLSKSKLFTTHPAQRFADEYKVSEKIWNEIWKRHAVLDYSPKELCEFYYIKVGTPIDRQSMSKWLFRSRIYSMTRDVMKEGVKSVNSSFFGEMEEKVINEITRHLRNGETKDSHIMA